MSSKANRSLQNDKISPALKTVIELKNEGNNCFVNNKYKEALDYYSQAIEVCPDDYKDELSKIYQNRAAVYEKLNNLEKVVDECSKALELNDRYQKALSRRASAAAKLKNFQMTIEDLCSLFILEKEPNIEHIMTSKMLIKIYAHKLWEKQKKNSKPLTVKKYMIDHYYSNFTKDPVYNKKELFEELEASKDLDESKEMYNAVNEFNNENYEKCIEHCTNEIKKKGKYINEARNLRGSIFHERLQFAEAVMDFNEITNSPKASNRMKANAFLKIPHSIFELKEYTVPKLLDFYDKAIELDPTNDDIYVVRAALLPMINPDNDSKADFEMAIKLNPNNKTAHINKAFYEYFKLFQKTAASYGCEMDENEFFYFPSEVKLNLEKEARKLEPLLQIFNDIAEPFRQYANIMHELQKYKEADKYYKIAIERQPKNGELYGVLARNHALWKENDYETPFKILTEALKVDDTCEDVYARFLQLEMKYEKYEHAVELHKKGLDLRTNYDEEAAKYLCSMFIVAQTQLKMIQKYGKAIPHLDSI